MTCIIYKTSFISLFSFSSTGRSKNSVYRVKLCDLLSVHQSRRHFSKQGPRRTVNARKVRAGLCHTTRTLSHCQIERTVCSRYFAREPRHFDTMCCEKFSAVESRVVRMLRVEIRRRLCVGIRQSSVRELCRKIEVAALGPLSLRSLWT